MSNNDSVNPFKDEQLSITLDDLESSLDGYADFSKKSGGINDISSPLAEPNPEQNTTSEQLSEKTAENAEDPSGSPDENARENANPELSEEQAEKPEENSPESPAEPAEKLSDMAVMEHTASIWQYKEIAQNGTETRTEYHTKSLEMPLASVIGARVRGKKHKHEGSNCDDFFETAVTDDCVIAVVCDGAGSKALSRIGSRLSAETAADFLKEKVSDLFKNLPEIKNGLRADMSSAEFMASCGRIAPLLHESAKRAYAAQQSHIPVLCEDENYKNSLGREPMISDLYTTFLAAVIVPLAADEKTGEKKQTFMACIQIGDGCICALDSAANSDSCLRVMGEADSGAFSGETIFLSEKSFAPEVLGAKTRMSRGSSDTVLLMSDGVADDYFPAQPMMKRLYLDLCLNGIFPMERGEFSAPCGTEPAPISFKSVSREPQSVGLQYAKQLLSDNAEDAVNALWDRRGELYCHSLEAFGSELGDTPEERLRVWLDNYNERGSFDDRTLVAVRISPTGK